MLLLPLLLRTQARNGRIDFSRTLSSERFRGKCYYLNLNIFTNCEKIPGILPKISKNFTMRKFASQRKGMFLRTPNHGSIKKGSKSTRNIFSFN